MYTKEVLTTSEVNRVMTSARAEAARNKLPVSIAVVDDGGHPLALERTDDAAPLSAYVAIEKARTAALGRRESKVFEDNRGFASVRFTPDDGLRRHLPQGLVVAAGRNRSRGGGLRLSSGGR